MSAGLAGQLVALGVWGRAALLAVLFVVVLVGRDRLAARGIPPPPRRPGPCPRAVRRHAGPAAVVAVYVGLALWVTGSWWTPLGGRITAVNPADATLFAWLLTWTPARARRRARPPLYAPR